MQTNTIYLGSDHAGFEDKAKLIKYLTRRGHECVDQGTSSTDSTDYPEYAHKVAEAVQKKKGSCGILICGTGNGVCMTANRHAGIRAGLAWESEIASLIRQHNDANILCMPARYVGYRKMISIVNTFLTTPFEGGRHLRRVNKIEC